MTQQSIHYIGGRLVESTSGRQQEVFNPARVLSKFKELIEKHHNDLVAAITREHGKVFSDVKGTEFTIPVAK